MRRILQAATVAATMLIGIFSAPTAASAAPPAPGYYMLVNDAYPSKCLSANNSTPPGGSSGTYTLYLANCNSATLTQWWKLPPTAGFEQVDHYQRFSDGTRRCLSKNLSTPPGGSSGTHHAYTAVCGSEFHNWQRRIFNSANPHEVQLVNNVMTYPSTEWCLSATHNNPLPGGGYRVYGAICNSGTAAQQWRPWQP